MELAPRSILRPPAYALLFPDTFFQERVGNLYSAGRVVLAVAGLHAVGYYAVLVCGALVASGQHRSPGVLELLADLRGPILAMGLAAGLFVVLNWLVVGAVLQVAVSFKGGEGSVTDTLAVVGWSSPAALLGFLVTGAGFLLGVAGNTAAMSFDAKLAAVAPSVAAAGTVGGLLTLLWQSRIWPAGLQHVHDVDRSAAVQATAATVALGAVVVLFRP